MDTEELLELIISGGYVDMVNVRYLDNDIDIHVLLDGIRVVIEGTSLPPKRFNKLKESAENKFTTQ